MVVLDNIIFSLQRAGGISVVWQNLISQYQRAGLDMRFIDLPGNAANLSRRELQIDNGLIIPAMWMGRSVSQFIHPRVKSDSPFIFHSSYYRTSRSPQAINVTTVHDFIVEKRAKTLKDRLRVALNHDAIRRSQAVVCVSNETRADLLRFMPDITPNRVFVINNGVSELFRPLNERPFPQYSGWLMYVGGRQGYKHFDIALSVASHAGCGLVICGAPLKHDEKKLLDKVLGNKYRVFEYPADDTLNSLYNSVKALIYPSGFEGFGLPVAEAQRAGCPVIAMDGTTAAHIGGDAVMTFCEGDDGAAAEHINLLSDPALRHEVVERGLRNSEQYSWERAAEKYMEIYRSLLASV